MAEFQTKHYSTNGKPPNFQTNPLEKRWQLEEQIRSAVVTSDKTEFPNALNSISQNHEEERRVE